MDTHIASMPVRLLATADRVSQVARGVQELPTGGLTGLLHRNDLRTAVNQARLEARNAVSLLGGDVGDGVAWARAGVDELVAALGSPGPISARVARDRIAAADRAAAALRTTIRTHAPIADPAPATSPNQHAAQMHLALLQRMDASSDAAGVVRDRFRSLVSRDPDDLSHAEWRHLSDLLGLEHLNQHLPEIPPTPADYRPFAEGVDRLARGIGRPAGGTRRVFAEFARQLQTPATTPESLIRGYVFRDPGSLTGTEWARLERAIADAPEHLRPPARIETKALPIKTIIADLIEGSYRPNRGTRAWTFAWRERLEPGYLQRYHQSLVNSIGTGRFDPSIGIEEVRPGAPFWRQVDVPTEQLPAIQHRAQLLALANHVPATRYETSEWLDALEPLLADIPTARPGSRQLLHRANDLIADNRQRLRGETPDGAVRGYARHPEYAELGRIAANVQLLAHAAWEQPAQAPALRSTANAQELLRW